MVKIKNKRILLVGASGVLGSEYVKFFHENGAKLVISDKKTNKYEKLINKYKNIKFIYCNLEKETEIIKMAKKAAKFFKGLDGVIAISNAIPTMGAMTSLDISANDLRAEGAKHIAAAIAECK